MTDNECGSVSTIKCVVSKVSTEAVRVSKGLGHATVEHTTICIDFEPQVNERGHHVWPTWVVRGLTASYAGLPRHKVGDVVPGLYEVISGALAADRSRL